MAAGRSAARAAREGEDGAAEEEEEISEEEGVWDPDWEEGGDAAETEQEVWEEEEYADAEPKEEPEPNRRVIVSPKPASSSHDFDQDAEYLVSRFARVGVVIELDAVRASPEYWAEPMLVKDLCRGFQCVIRVNIGTKSF